MIKYELTKNSRELKYKERNKIKQGCTLEQIEQSPEVIKSFEDKDKALEELKSYKTEIRCSGPFYDVEEYYIEENEYDEAGEFIQGGDVWGISPIFIGVVEKETCKILGIYDNMEAAEKAYNNCEQECYLDYSLEGNEHIMATKEKVLENLEKLIGQKFDADEIICAFEDFEADEYGENEVIVKDSEDSKEAKYDTIAYVNGTDTTQFLFALDKNNIIRDVIIGGGGLELNVMQGRSR